MKNIRYTRGRHLSTHGRSEGCASTDGSECVGGETTGHSVHHDAACNAQIASDCSSDQRPSNRLLAGCTTHRLKQQASNISGKKNSLMNFQNSRIIFVTFF